MSKLKVGFIGLGLMGGPMALNIHKAGFPLTVYNRSPKRLTPFKKLGIPTAKTPAELAAASDIIITIVTGPKDVEEVVLGKSGVVQGASQGSIVIDMSTIGPQATKLIAEQLSRHKIDFLDAPVTGGTRGAISGELTIFVGGKRAIYEKALPVLKAMGTNIPYMGPIGMGQAIKLVNNLLVGSTLISLSEGLILAEAQGLSRKKTAEVLEKVPVVSAMMKMKMPMMVSGKFKTTFSVANIFKDLDLAFQEIKKSGKSTPQLEQSRKLYQQALDLGMADEDNAAILKLLEK